jgi:F-type H+-transporting ATPase subunit epsilon
MSEKLSFEIVTPEKIVLSESDVDFVGVDFFKTDDSGQGSLGIMKDHAPMLVRLSTTPIRYKKENDTFYAVVAGGFLEVQNNKITILSAGAEVVVKEPDVDLAITARKRVESWLKGNVGKVDFDEQAAEVDIKKSAIDLYKASSHSD